MLVPIKRGPKVDERANARLAVKLQKSELIIDARKGSLRVLGLPEPYLSELDEPK